MHPDFVRALDTQYQQEARERAARWRLGRLVRRRNDEEPEASPGTRRSRRQARAAAARAEEGAVATVAVSGETEVTTPRSDHAEHAVPAADPDTSAVQDATEPSSVEVTEFACVR